MPKMPLQFPVGVRDQSTYAASGSGGDQAQPVTVPPSGQCNTRNIEISGRRRPAARNRKSRAFQDQLPGGVAMLYAGGKATTVTRRYGPLRPLAGGLAVDEDEGVPRSQDTVTGCCRLIDGAGNSFFGFSDPVHSSLACQCVALDNCEDITAGRGQKLRGAFACNYTKAYGGAIGNQVVVRVSYFADTDVYNAFLGVVTRSWTSEVEDMAAGGGSVTASAVDLPVQSVAVCGPWVFVAVKNYVYCFAATTELGYTAGQYVARYMFGSFSTIRKIEVVCNVVRDTLNNAVQYTQNTAELVVAGDGDTTVTGAVTTSANSEGLYFRAGIDRVRIILRTQNAGALQDTDAPFADPPESTPESHTTLRLSDWTGTGRGRAVFDMAIWNPALGADTTQFVRTANALKAFLATTNDGFGRTNAAADKPDGTGGYANLFCIDDGHLWDGTGYNTPSPIKWRVDTHSRKTDWQGTGDFNDIPYAEDSTLDPDNGVGPEPSITSVAVGKGTGTCFVAGKDSGGWNVYAYAVAGGSLLWRNTVGAFVPRGCASYYAPEASYLQNQESVVIAAARNSAWPDADSVNATLFFLNPLTGAIERTRDFGSGIKIWSVASDKRVIAVGSDYF